MFPIWHGSLFNVALVDAVAHFVVVVLVVSVFNVAVLPLIMLLFFLNSFNGWLAPHQRLLEKIETDKLEWPFKFFNGD